MYSLEQRRVAIETFIKFGYSYADTIAELGYPNRQSLRSWWNDYREHGEVRPGKPTREPRFTLEMRQAAVDHYLDHGKSLARTMRAMGYPKSKECLVKWIDELAPGQRKVMPSATPGRRRVPLEEKIRAVAELESRDGTAAEVADRHGVARVMPYVWRKQMLTGDNPDVGDEPAGDRRPVSREYDKLPTDEAELTQMALKLRAEVRRLQIELDVRSATLEIVKKDLGTDPNRLTNREKALLVDSLRGRWKLKELLAAVGMAKSSYEYAANALKRPETEKERAVREAVVRAFKSNGGTYGYRRLLPEVNDAPGIKVGEWTVRKIMKERDLVACAPRKKRRYSSYVGEVSEAPENACLDEKGRHHFSADKPNELWITDITEFRIPAGKCYLSPIIDCFDGMPIGWSIGTSPSAELANSSLLRACAQLRDGEHPCGHSDRGGHYRWPGWIAICDEHGIARSMSRKGCSPDNSRAEGFFGRLKVEFFYGRGWDDISMGEFMEMLDAYLVWYRDKRRKSDLGYMSPMQYRRSLGLVA